MTGPLKLVLELLLILITTHHLISVTIWIYVRYPSDKKPTENFQKGFGPVENKQTNPSVCHTQSAPLPKPTGSKAKKTLSTEEKLSVSFFPPSFNAIKFSKNNNQGTPIGYVTPRLIGNALELGKMDVRDLNSESELKAATLFMLCPCIFVLLLPDGTAHTEVSDRPHPDLRGKKLHQRLI